MTYKEMLNGRAFSTESERYDLLMLNVGLILVLVTELPVKFQFGH